MERFIRARGPRDTVHHTWWQDGEDVGDIVVRNQESEQEVTHAIKLQAPPPGNKLPSVRFCLLKVPLPSQTVPPAGVQVCEHAGLRGL